ncbi:hypothetical protein D3093_33905 (plasmid) [Azospirillum argentinense]|uniref:CHAP domain-containing protein n=1 Tax=Azospirillum argentinense TaxID=2970906 RepID=A0A4D8PXS1_9PROT|nr:hypothetical protein [Azospirillum argentinense]QCO00236.1 hypothetical protein D3093_33905 [Azospirillum argentinense]
MSRDLTRRSLIASAPLALALLGSTPISAQLAAGAAEADYDDYFSPDVPDLVSLGTDPALSAEVQKALDIIAKAPSQGTPLDVMQYLEAIQDTNRDSELYNAGWKVRWNPVIVTFFQATKTKPAGDTTFWCAASLNWCLKRTSFQPTNSAGSGSFRGAPGKTAQPKPGDIVVFRHADDTLAKAGRGHVGLFLERTDDAVHVLGGNQMNQKKHSAVCRKWIPTKGSTLILHSYHAIDAFRRV